MGSQTIGTRKPCCQQASNLYQRPDEQRPDLRVDRCRVCECRHFRAKADPGRIGARGMGIGAAAARLSARLFQRLLKA